MLNKGIGGEGSHWKGRNRSVAIYDIYLYEEKKKKEEEEGWEIELLIGV